MDSPIAASTEEIRVADKTWSMCVRRASRATGERGAEEVRDARSKFLRRTAAAGATRGSQVAASCKSCDGWSTQLASRDRRASADWRSAALVERVAASARARVSRSEEGMAVVADVAMEGPEGTLKWLENGKEIKRVLGIVYAAACVQGRLTNVAEKMQKTTRRLYAAVRRRRRKCAQHTYNRNSSILLRRTPR